MTTISTLANPWTLLDAAVRTRRPVQVTYHGRRRLICPHALGWKNGKAMVLAYQTAEHTSTGVPHPDPRKRWRCMYLDQIDHIDQADPASRWHTPDNYNYTNPFPFPVTDHLAIAITQ